MDDSNKGFNAKEFYNALAATVTSRGVTWKDVSTATKVSASTLTRMAQGRQPDAASLAALSAWAGLNPADYVDQIGKRQTADPLVAALALFRADPKLQGEAKDALTSIISAAYNQLAKKDKP